jgi:NTE family protein
LDRPTARAVLSRFGATIPDLEDESENGSADEERPTGRDDDTEMPDLPRLGGFDVMNRTIDIAQSALARHTLAAYPPDVLIEVPRTTCRSLEFHRAVEVIGAGRRLANRALDAFENPENNDDELPAAQD